MDRFRRITRKVRDHKLVSTKTTDEADAGGGKYEQSPVTTNEFQNPTLPPEGVLPYHKRSRARKLIPWDVHPTEEDVSSKPVVKTRDKSCPPALEKAGNGTTAPANAVKTDHHKSTLALFHQGQPPSPPMSSSKPKPTFVEAAPFKTTAVLSKQEQPLSPPISSSNPTSESTVTHNHSSSGFGVQEVQEKRLHEHGTHQKPAKRMPPVDIPAARASAKNSKPPADETSKKAVTNSTSLTATFADNSDSNPLLGVESSDADYFGTTGKCSDPPLQHQAPPLPDKRPSPPSPTQGAFPQQLPLTNGHDMTDGGERLHHMNQDRPRGPARRPPSAIFKGNMRNSSGDSESSSLSIESPPKSNNLSAVPKMDFPPIARHSSLQPPTTAKPDSSSGQSSQPSSPAPAAPKEIDQNLSSIILRANSGRAGAPPTSSMMPSGAEPAPSRSPMARPNTTFMAGANQSTVPWLQELNAKQQKRKSQIIEPGGKDGDPPAPPVSAKPSVPSAVKPHAKLPPSSPQPQPDTPSAKQAPRTFASKQFGSSQQQRSSSGSFSSTVASQPQDVVDTPKTPQQPPQSTARSIKAQHHQHTPQLSASTTSTQPEVELRHPPVASQPPSSIQPDIRVKRTPSTSSQNSSTAGSQPDVQPLRKPLTEPDVIPSTSSSRKLSAASTSTGVSSATAATEVTSTKFDGSASIGSSSSAASSRSASIAGDGEAARLSNAVSAAAVVRAAHESPSVSSVTGPPVSVAQAPAPTPQRSSVDTESLGAPAGTSSTTTTATPSPIPSTTAGTHVPSTLAPHPSAVPSSHHSKKHTNSDKVSSVISGNTVIPKDVIEDAKALDHVNAILNKLLPKVSALETRLEEQKREHNRQLNMLMTELDDERKKRACLEIEMERLRKMLLTYTTHV